MWWFLGGRLRSSPAYAESSAGTELGNLVHEWKESALVAKGGMRHDAMFSAEGRRVDPPDPSELLHEDAECTTTLAVTA